MTGEAYGTRYKPPTSHGVSAVGGWWFVAGSVRFARRLAVGAAASSLALAPSAQADGPRVRIGGTLREQYEAYRNFELRPESVGLDAYHLHRLMLFADVRVTDRSRLFVELGNALAWGKERPLAPVDENELFVQQAYVAYCWERLGRETWADWGAELRIGRQELSFGSGRLISLRDGPNVRRSFDVAALTLERSDRSLDVFAGAEVQNQRGSFDDEPSTDVRVWGVYQTLFGSPERERGVDLYYLGLDRDDAQFAAGAGDELRHSLGVRSWGKAGRLDYNFEPVVQFGAFAERDLAAWTLASDTGWRIGDSDRSPRLGLRANVASGGQSEGRLETFNALFPNNSYFSEAAIVAPANLIDVNPELTLAPIDGLEIDLLWDFLWRYDKSDDIYGPPGVPILPVAADGSRFIGHSISMNARYQLHARAHLFASYAHFEAGSSVRAAGGTDLDYFLLGVDWSF